MASKDEPTQSGRQSLSMEHVRRDVQLHSVFDEIFQLVQSICNQCSTEMSLQNVATAYPSKTMFNILLDILQSPSYPFVKDHWKKDENEYVIGTKVEYKDPVTKLIQCFLEECNLTDIIKYVVEIYIPLNVIKTPSPNQLHVHVPGVKCKVAVLTGLFKGECTYKFAVTVAHVVSEIDESIYENARKELIGYWRLKRDIIKIAHQDYTADMALIALDPKGRLARDKRSVIEIQGQRCWPKLCSKEQINNIKPGAELWIVDQLESLKLGKLFRHWYNNKCLELHNVIQIQTTDGKALTIAGDSGCCVCLPLKRNSDEIEVIGMVIGISEFPDKTSCTNAVLLPIVLKHIIGNLPKKLRKMGEFCEDEGLAANVDFTEGLDFYIGDKSENLTVQSENSIGSSKMEIRDSGVDCSGNLHCEIYEDIV